MLDNRSIYLRKLALRCMRGGGRGHLGSTFSLIEIMRVLYDDIKRPDDKVILSKGHGAIAQYIMLADKGIIPMEELDKFCRKDGILGGHPSHKVPGIECDTGALGHGLNLACGMAIAAKMRKQTHRVFVIVGDGELGEGSCWEAMMCASKHKLDNLTVVIDYNKIQSAGFVKDIQPLEPLADKWRAFGWAVAECNGHDIGELVGFLECYMTKSDHGKDGHGIGIADMPRCLIAHTVKGKGIPVAENNPAYHHKASISEEEFQAWEVAFDQAA